MKNFITTLSAVILFFVAGATCTGTIHAYAVTDPQTNSVGPGRSCWGSHFELVCDTFDLVNPLFQWQWYDSTLGWVNHVDGMRFAQGAQTNHLTLDSSGPSPWKKTFYHRVLVTSDSCSVQIDSVTTIGLVQTPFSALMEPMNGICPGDTLVIWGEPETPDSNYMNPVFWWFTSDTSVLKTNSSSSWSDSITITAPMPGTYSIQIHYTDVCGGNGLINRPYWVNSCIQVNIDTQSPARTKTLFYPNPVHSKLTIETPSSSEPTSITMVNAFGKRINSWTTVGKKEIDVSTIRSGIYLFQVDEYGTRSTKKIIIQH